MTDKRLVKTQRAQVVIFKCAPTVVINRMNKSIAMIAPDKANKAFIKKVYVTKKL